MKLIISSILLIISLFTAKAELKASLLTLAPGNEVYELEGHTELRFTDHDQDLDMTVSWGVFDFDSPGFLYRFVKGETDYMAVSKPYVDFLLINGFSGRRVTEQQLNLDSIEVKRLLELVECNLLPENRVYRYNYVKDNCATRPMALIEQAICGTIRHPGDTITATTWRAEMSSYHANYPWYQFGIDMALGSGIDKPITGRETCYSPVALSRFIGSASRPDGRPMVKGEQKIILEGTPEGLPSSPTPWYLTPMFAACVILALTILTARRDMNRRHPSRWLYTILYGLAGMGGLVLTFLIFFSTHEATSPNWLFLWLNPFCFIGITGVWLKKHNSAVYFYQIVNFVALIVLAAIGFTGTQHLNVAVYPLILSYFITAAEYIYLYRCQTKSTSPSKAV